MAVSSGLSCTVAGSSVYQPAGMTLAIPESSASVVSVCPLSLKSRPSKRSRVIIVLPSSLPSFNLSTVCTSSRTSRSARCRAWVRLDVLSCSRSVHRVATIGRETVKVASSDWTGLPASPMPLECSAVRVSPAAISSLLSPLGARHTTGPTRIPGLFGNSATTACQNCLTSDCETSVASGSLDIRRTASPW